MKPEMAEAAKLEMADMMGWVDVHSAVRGALIDV